MHVFEGRRHCWRTLVNDMGMAVKETRGRPVPKPARGSARCPLFAGFHRTLVAGARRGLAAALAWATARASDPVAGRAQGTLDALIRLACRSRRLRRRSSGQQLVGIVGLVFADRCRCRHRAHGFSRLRVLRCRGGPLGMFVSSAVSVRGRRRAIVVLLLVALPIVAALVAGVLMLRLMIAPLLLMTALLMIAALLMATLLLAALVAATLAVALMVAALLVATLMVATLAEVEVGVWNPLWIGAARRVERGRQTLADILHVDVGDGEFTAADARPLAVVHRRQDPVVMVGVLKEILCRDPVSGCPRVARELQVLVEHLIGVAPNPQFLPSAVEALAFIVAAAHSMRFARSPTASAAVVIILFHLNVTSSSTMVERFLANRAACHRPSAFLYVNRHAAVPLGARRSQCAEALFRADFAMRWPAFPRARPMSAPTAGADPKGFRAAFQQLF